ncbi:MAG: DUF1802 family protein [Algisphaera sp.]
MIDIALKEWACVCDLLAQGSCTLLLRKGGVHEIAGPGRFSLEHDRFAFFPAWEHEQLDWVKPALKPDRGPIEVEPNEITFCGWGEVAGIWPVPTRGALDALDDLHPWLAPQIDMRFNYKPDRPVYALLVRAYALSRPVMRTNRTVFAGCRSWVPLAEDAIDTAGSTLAIEADVFGEINERVAKALG